MKKFNKYLKNEKWRTLSEFLECQGMDATVIYARIAEKISRKISEISPERLLEKSFKKYLNKSWAIVGKIPEGNSSETSRETTF